MSLNLSSNFLQFKIEMGKSSKHSVYEFDGFRLDAAKLMLYDRGGREIFLPPKVIETLVVFVENQGEILSKDELMDKVWSDSIVEESNLSQYLYLLRKTLGNQSDGTPFIETLRRRGYRFNAEVRFLEDTQPSRNEISDAPRFEVQRQGNVLKIADWNKNAENPSTTKPAKNLRFRNISIGTFALIAVLAAVLLFSLSFINFKSEQKQNTLTEKRAEMSFLRLTNGIVPMDATISPDGKYFVYHEQDGATAHLWVQQTGQSSRLEIVAPAERLIHSKTFTPDSQFIYFLAQDKADSPNSLYRVPTLGGVQSKILDDVNFAVSFSPDGSEMVFRRENRQTGESSLIIAASDGTNERVLLTRTRGQELLLYPAWSPDGKRIAFGAMFPQGDLPPYFAIFTVNRQTGETKQISPEKWENCYRMVWTRDGQGLVFVGTKYAEALSTRRDQIYYLSIETGEARRLTNDGSRHQITSLGITDDDSIIAVPFNRSTQIWQMPPNGNSRSAVQITNGLADGRAGIAPLADGRIGYLARTGENLNVWIMNADGTNQKQINNEPPVVEELRASPDGRYFIFAAVRDGNSRLFRLDADGGNLRQLTFGDSQAIDSTVSPDGNWIVYDSSNFDGSSVKHTLLKIPIDGGEAVHLAAKDCVTPHFSPDGKYISCIYREKEILVISAETGETVKSFQPVQNPLFICGAKWTKDGQNLVYIVQRKDVSNLWVQPLNGTPAQPLTDFNGGNIYNFAFSANGLNLYVARGYPIQDAVMIKNFR